VQIRLEQDPEMMKVCLVEHTFVTNRFWKGSTQFLTKTLPRVSTENEPSRARLHKRMMSISASQGYLRRSERNPAACWPADSYMGR